MSVPRPIHVPPDVKWENQTLPALDQIYDTGDWDLSTGTPKNVPNPFILFKMWRARTRTTKSQVPVSQEWSTAGDAVKEHFKQLFDELFKKHKEMFHKKNKDVQDAVEVNTMHSLKRKRASTPESPSGPADHIAEPIRNTGGNDGLDTPLVKNLHTLERKSQEELVLNPSLVVANANIGGFEGLAQDPIAEDTKDGNHVNSAGSPSVHHLHPADTDNYSAEELRMLADFEAKYMTEEYWR